MKDLLISAMLIAVGVIGLNQADSLDHLYNSYLERQESQQALDSCAAASAAFDRFDPAERDSCFARMHLPPPSVRQLGPPSIPKDDIRRIQAVRH